MIGSWQWPPGETEARAEVVQRRVRAGESLAGELRNTSWDGQRKIRGDYPTGQRSGCNFGIGAKSQARPDTADAPLVVADSSVDFPPEPEVQREPGTELEIVLEEASVVRCAVGFRFKPSNAPRQKDVAHGRTVLCRALAHQEIRKAEKVEESTPRAWVVEIKLRTLYLEARSQRVPAARPCNLVRILKLIYRGVRVVVEISTDGEQAVYRNDRHLGEGRLAGGNADILVLDFALARKDSRIPVKTHERLVHEMCRQRRGEFQRGQVVSKDGLLSRAGSARHKQARTKRRELGSAGIEIALR